MLGEIPRDAGLEIARRTNLQMDALANQVLDQRRILNTPHAVPDPRRLKFAQRFPNAVRPPRLARMSRAIQPVFNRIMKRGNVGINRISGFIAGDIEGSYPASAKLLHQLGSR